MAAHTTQPNTINWMVRLEPIIGCPYGLEYIKDLDQVQVEQISKLPEEFSNWERNSKKLNKYLIKNSKGQRMYYAVQETPSCYSCCFSNSLTTNIIDNFNKSVMKIERKYRCFTMNCFSSCFNSCSHQIKLEAPIGQTYGYAFQKSNFCKPYYKIMDENMNSLVRIEGPCCFVNEMMCPLENYFIVMPIDKNLKLGKISKQYASTVADINSQTIGNRFGTTFPIDMPIKTKSNLIAFLFLLNNMYFE